MEFREVIAVHCPNRKKLINKICVQKEVFNVKNDSTYSYHCFTGLELSNNFGRKILILPKSI
jgi:hypothetical protein